MDFSYFNAVLKSTTFPPYDPWYAGGYLNYYYYGYLLVGVLVKWLGIVPAIAYNLILPTLFCMIALGAFSVAWNLAVKAKASRAKPESEASPEASLRKPLQLISPAIAAAFGMAVLGNLGTVKMIYEGFQKLVAPGGTDRQREPVRSSELGSARFPEELGRSAPAVWHRRLVLAAQPDHPCPG